MNLLKRFKRLWELSTPLEPFDLIGSNIKGKTGYQLGLGKERPKMAQIIKRQTPAEKFLKDEQ